MPRRKKQDFSRIINPDSRFGSVRMQKLINVVMRRGKKNIARTIVYNAMNIIAKKQTSDEKALELFNNAFEQLIPHVEVRARRVGGSVYQVPVSVRPKRQESLAFRWLIQAAQGRNDKTMGERLAYELIEAHEGRGGAVKKRTEVQRMAEANRAFSHYAW